MRPLPEHVSPKKNKAAFAPYNFIPLPNEVVAVDDLPHHDRFTGLSGHFDIRLTTQTAVYIRSLLTEKEFQWQQEKKDNAGDDITKDTPFRKILKNKADFFHLKDEDAPVIPGSSLRGMIRALFEIITFSKLQFVSDAQKMFFRAVAAPSTDPLRDPYRDVIGGNASKVHVGYLEQDDERKWHVRPAKTPKEVDGRLSTDRYIKVRKDAIQNGSVALTLDGFRDLDHQLYQPHYNEVTFDIGEIWYINQPTNKNPNGVKKTPLSANKITATGLPYKGTLVGTGNMLETNDGTQDSLRRNIYLIPEKSTRPRLQIDEQAISDYRAALTPFQAEKPFSDRDGVLQKDRPIFYIPPKNGEPICYFGHTPNFRIAHQLYDANGQHRAATPRDFVPAALRNEEIIDMSDAVFGYVRSRQFREEHPDKPHSYSGRVFITDARFENAEGNLYLDRYGDHALTTKILASPKPTAFQHYLTQDSSERGLLNHYGSTTPDPAVIRGSKMYWHRGKLLPQDIKHDEEKDGELKEASTQHTRMKPLNEGVTFTFKVYFDNLTPAELGALAWTLALPRQQCHNIGMGKSLGMGAVRLHDIELHVANRQQRYTTLFEGKKWHLPTQAEVQTIKQYQQQFERHMLNTLNVDHDSFAAIPRIAALLTMLQWWQRNDSWLQATRYMQIEPGDNTENEYKNRPVLPDPQTVVAHHKPAEAMPNEPTKPRIRQTPILIKGLEIAASSKNRVRPQEIQRDGLELNLPPNLLENIPANKQLYVYIPAKYANVTRSYNRGTPVPCIVEQVIEDEYDFIIECRHA